MPRESAHIHLNSAENMPVEEELNPVRSGVSRPQNSIRTLLGIS